MGAFQLPDSVVGVAVVCLIYSFLCLFANCVLIWLIWTHHERSNYVAFIAYFALLATVSSVIQQFYDYVFWRDIMIEQFDYGRDHAHDAEVQYQKATFGLKLGLSYIRIFSITVEASLVFFFSLSLTATVYGWWAKTPRTLRTMSLIGRIVPVVLATISIILLRLEFTHSSFAVYMTVANVQYVLALLGSCTFLLMILFKYLQSRHQLKTWQGVQYGQGGSRSTNTSQSFMKSRRSRAFSSGTSKARNPTFDNWLVVRLTIAFLTLCVFEYTNVTPRLSNKRKVLASLNEVAPDLSEERAMSTVTGYLSGVSPSMLAFLVFGTTKTFQRKMYTTFVPRFLRRTKNDEIIRCRHASHQPLPYYTSSANGNNHNNNNHNNNTTGSRSSHMPTTSIAYSPGDTPRKSLSHMPSSSSLLPLRRPPSAVLPEGDQEQQEQQQPPSSGGIRHETKGIHQHHHHHNNHNHLAPIHEPDRTWLAEGSDTTSPTESTTRRSQIGVAIGTPTQPSPSPSMLPKEGKGEREAGGAALGGRRKEYHVTGGEADGNGSTFFRDDSPDSFKQIPMSRFNNNTNTNNSGSGSGSGCQTNVNGTLCRSGSVASTTTVIWSEGRKGSSGTSRVGISIPRKSYAKYQGGSLRRKSPGKE